MRYLPYIFVFTQSLVLCVCFVPIVIKLAFRFGVLDKPGHRKVHQRPKPLLGGMAIFSSFFWVVVLDLVLFFALYQSTLFQSVFPQLVDKAAMVYETLFKLSIILTGGALVHILGLGDDIFSEKLSYKFKFFVQFCIALGVAVFGVRTDFMPGQWLDIVITTVWIMGITNGFNLLDNLDGLTAGISLIAALIFFGVAILQGQIFFAFMLMALAGSSLGFLLFNFHPAKLFMGDSGSLFLGYIFAALTVMGSYVVPDSPTLIPVVMPLLILSLPLYDTFSVMFIRRREGRPLFEGDKRHFSHRLLALGMGHRGTVIFIYLVCFVVGISATLLPYVTVAGSILLLLQAVIVYTLITILIAVAKDRDQDSRIKQRRHT